MESIIHKLPYLLPIIVLGNIPLVFALVDIARRKHVAGGNKVIWVLVAVFIQFVGPIIYLAAGRKEKSVDCD